MGNQLNDNDFGTRDKRGHWKPFGTISINPPKDCLLYTSPSPRD